MKLGLMMSLIAEQEAFYHSKLRMMSRKHFILINSDKGLEY
jgi:hypothetical protein